MAFYCVPFTEIQEELQRNCPEEYFTILMRRLMMEIACKLAEREDCGAIITGESLGQVASQTIYSLAVTNEVCTLPVFRPLIGMDKEATVRISRDIGAFETSILPFEDCCTIFVAKHPKTHPKHVDIEEAEKNLDIEAMVKQGVEENLEVIKI